MQTQAEAITGHGRDLNNALGNLGPFAEDAAVLVDILNRQQPAVQRLIANTGVVFGALTERDGQLRELIENSNRVFATTAERDEELRQAFVALPTFERESRQTIDRLTEFARDDRSARDPAAARRARALADADRPRGAGPGPRGVLPRPRPADRRLAARASRPPSARCGTCARCSRSSIRSRRQLNPVLSALGFYKRELTAFFANTVAATQATRAVGHRARPLPAHDEPVRPGEPRRLSAPHRVRTARTPTRCPGHFDKLREGLDSYETRQCTPPRGIPVIDNTPSPVRPDLATGPVGASQGVVNGLFSYPQSLIDEILRFGFPAGNTHSGPAPPCRQQAKFPLGGELTQYPHVKADP